MQVHFSDVSGPKSLAIKEFGTTGIKQLMPAVLSSHLADQRTLKDAVYAKFVRKVDDTNGPQLRVVVKQSNGANLVIKTAAVDNPANESTFDGPEALETHINRDLLSVVSLRDDPPAFEQDQPAPSGGLHTTFSF